MVELAQTRRGRASRKRCATLSRCSVHSVADLLISRVSPGVATARSVDLFDTLVIYRVEREHWQETPQKPGVYLLYGTAPDGKLTVYIGQSTTNMRDRVRSHHVNPRKNWFGVLFAVPVPNALLCLAIEAELIGQVNEAGVVDVIVNQADERRHRHADDVHVDPAVDKIREALELLLGSDIFTPSEPAEATQLDVPLSRMTQLAREYRGQAAEPRQRTAEDPAGATHAWVGAGVGSWGRFEADEPDTRFRVLAGGNWRRATLNPADKTHKAQVRLAAKQSALVSDGVLDYATLTFAKDHVFDSWTAASHVVSGKASYAGGYHWQRLIGDVLQE
jgi:hypothetical protein